MAALLSCWTNSDEYIARHFYKVPCPRATLFNFSSEITAPRAARKKLPRRVRKVGEIWCMPRGIFPQKRQKKRNGFLSLPREWLRRLWWNEASVSPSHSPQRDCPRDTLLADCSLVFSRHTRRHWFSNSVFAFYPATRLSVESRRHQSWSFPPFQAQRPPLPEEFLKYENLCRGRTCPLMMRHEDNPWNFYTR